MSLGHAFFERHSPQAAALWKKAEDVRAEGRPFFIVGGEWIYAKSGRRVRWRAKLDVSDDDTQDDLISRYFVIVRRTLTRIAEQFGIEKVDD